MALAHKDRLQFAIAVFVPARNVEIEHAHTVARFPLINAAVTRAYHNTSSSLLFAAKINHGVGYRRVALYRVGSGPEKQIAGLQVFQFERVLLLTQDGFKLPTSAEPDILLARIARHFSDVILFEHIINKTRAIHSAGGRVGRAIFIIEIARGQFERRSQELLHLERIIFETFDLIRQQSRIRSTAFL